ncbi:hypothetical protein [Gymnodinialimonas ulvae]|uniref:hypothetical protein n=1 Tax=Gymnodinialimonas ulvae TaxID=3126504 RepID=UPI00309BA012
MALMVSIARTADVPNPGKVQEYREDHARVFGTYADLPKLLPDPNDPNQIAVVGEVHGLDGLRAASRTPEGDAMMRKWGFIEQLSFFVEEV